MFLFIRKKRKCLRRRMVSPYYIVSGIFLSVGIVLGFFYASAFSYSSEPGVHASAAAIFRFSFIKNTVLLMLTYATAFSLLGFPLNACLLCLNGYMISVSTQSLFLVKNTEKWLFLARIFPHVSLVFLAHILLSDGVFRFCMDLSSMFFGTKHNLKFGRDALHLTGRLFICIALILLAAWYEGYVLQTV